jgi:hypothetical protein
MWGIVASVAGAAIALAVIETVLTKPGAASDNASEQKMRELEKPEPGFKNKADGNFKAPLWQEGTAGEILERARKWGSKLKK